MIKSLLDGINWGQWCHSSGHTLIGWRAGESLGPSLRKSEKRSRTR
jgi:hypothetical protein